MISVVISHDFWASVRDLQRCCTHEFVTCTVLYYVLSAAAVYGNELMVCTIAIYSKVDPVILGPAESAMP